MHKQPAAYVQPISLMRHLHRHRPGTRPAFKPGDDGGRVHRLINVIASRSEKSNPFFSLRGERMPSLRSQ